MSDGVTVTATTTESAVREPVLRIIGGSKV